jgi:CO dehydrogenase nickel-insertion accessory protein CooC1
MNKQINLIINGKGGVGKSFFATNFVQYLKDCGIAHCAIDSDHESGLTPCVAPARARRLRGHVTESLMSLLRSHISARPGASSTDSSWFAANAI